MDVTVSILFAIVVAVFRIANVKGGAVAGLLARATLMPWIAMVRTYTLFILWKWSHRLFRFEQAGCTMQNLLHAFFSSSKTNTRAGAGAGGENERGVLGWFWL